MAGAAAMEQASALLKAAAHPTRLLLLEWLLMGEKCVCNLIPKGACASDISKHLSILKAAGLVKSRKAGLYVYYSIAIPEARLIPGLCRSAVASRYRAQRKAAERGG